MHKTSPLLFGMKSDKVSDFREFIFGSRIENRKSEVLFTKRGNFKAILILIIFFSVGIIQTKEKAFDEIANKNRQFSKD